MEPLTHSVHPILLPVSGTPILAYTLEFLERGGVEEIFVLTSSPLEIQAYIESSRWGEKGYPIKLRTISVPQARSTGDFMRELDRRNLVKGDFVLLRGGVVSNLPLPSIVEEHQKRRESDKDAMLMSMVLMQTETHTAFSGRR